MEEDRTVMHVVYDPGTQGPDITIESGRIFIYRLFDAASEIRLATVEARIKEETRRLRLSKYPYMKELEFTDPPLSFEFQKYTRTLFGQDLTINVIAKAYDFGVLSFSFEIPIPPHTPISALEAEAMALDSDGSFDKKAKEYLSQLITGLGDAVINPGIKESFTEDYMVFYIQQMDKKMETREFLDRYDPSRLLLYETQTLSASLKEEILRYRFSYYPDDLVILHLDNAFIIEPSGNLDILDILEFANAQLLELRYYDDVLDREMTKIYSELYRRGGASVFKLRSYERLAKNITQTVTEMTEVTEKVDNALKVTEDVYYARIYRTAMHLFRSKDWELSIKEKLQIVSNTYKMLSDEISVKRGHLIELGIFILIVIEIIILLIMEW